MKTVLRILGLWIIILLISQGLSYWHATKIESTGCLAFGNDICKQPARQAGWPLNYLTYHKQNELQGALTGFKGPDCSAETIYERMLGECNFRSLNLVIDLAFLLAVATGMAALFDRYKYKFSQLFKNHKKH